MSRSGKRSVRQYGREKFSYHSGRPESGLYRCGRSLSNLRHKYRTGTTEPNWNALLPNISQFGVSATISS